MRGYSYKDPENTYALTRPGFYFISDLRYELTSDVIVEGINAFMNKIIEEYEDNKEGLTYTVNGLNNFIDIKYFDSATIQENVSETLKGVVSFLNHNYLTEYDRDIEGALDDMVVYLFNEMDSTILMEGFEREWNNFYYLATDPETKSIFVYEVDKDQDILSISELFDKINVDIDLDL